MRGAAPHSAGGVRFTVPSLSEPAALRLPVSGSNHSALSTDLAPAILSVNGLAASQAMFKATQAALGGQVTAKDALARAAQEVNAAIKGEKCKK